MGSLLVYLLLVLGLLLAAALLEFLNIDFGGFDPYDF